MLNPMMSSLSRRRRLPDCKVIRSALCTLPLNGDGRRLRLTKITITVTFCSLSFLVSGIFTWEQARLTNRKLLQLPIILGTKIQRTVLTEHNPVRRSLLCCSKEGWSMESRFTVRFHLIDLRWNQPNTQCQLRQERSFHWRPYGKMFGYRIKGKVLLHLYVFITSQSRLDGFGLTADLLRSLRRS